MSARGFGSVIWAGTVAGAALGFYLVSLNVASERAALEEVETEIAMAQRDIRLLQTEIGTRGRLAQLERWNVKFIRLAAPSADQFVDGGFQLATLVAPQKKPAIEAPVILASAPIAELSTVEPQGASRPSRPVGEMMHVASYSVPDKPVATKPVAAKSAVPKPLTTKLEAKPTTAPAKSTTATKPAKSAMADPLSPLPGKKAKAKGDAPAASAGGAATPKAKSKDSVTDR